ncbi:histidine kinase [Caloramator sp. CAR-1]|uniref:sensor histidine kinase n=1 Tax=Caloramator sp. CAR-1 TaxID=3062777 RepID=UPI0026E1FD85|nr:ATP-binding protein [Caloramator sp. CAR-1]MDO6354992.1 histidine kinase [Caloramator sp. CAR-1]
MFYKLYKRIINLPDEVKIITFYRFFSLIITSTFYLFMNFNHSIYRKMFILLCITVAQILLNYTICKVKDSIDKIFILLTVETIGNAIILIPSGGLESPFIWLSLNTILVSALRLSSKLLWLNLSIYLLSITYFNLHFNVKSSFKDLMAIEFNRILSLVLISFAFQIISKKIKQLDKSNNKLKQKIDYIFEIYQNIHYLTSSKELETLIDTILKFTTKVTKTDYAFFLLFNDEDIKFYETKKNSIIKDIILKFMNEIKNSASPVIKNVENLEIILNAVRADYKTYGILGFAINSKEENIDQIKFLTELSSLSFDRIYFEDVKEKMLISKEQNRIANEIHDNVIQRLFSLSCKLYSFYKNIEGLDKELAKELIGFRNSIDSTMRLLRETIYDLSWNKYANDSFIVEINNYINDIKYINNAEINFNISGDIEILSILQKKALYRIICETLSNSIRHGKADIIDINLLINKEEVNLIITDNGNGFNVKAMGNSGIGLKNIKTLVDVLKGSIEIDSKIGKGTKLFIKLKNAEQKLEGIV